MSYQGFGNFAQYNPAETVDEVADYTDMQGDGSIANHNSHNSSINLMKNSPTRSLIALWVFIVLVYLLLQYGFRRYIV